MTGFVEGNEREWILRDGMKLKGKAYLNAVKVVEIQRQSSLGPGPTSAFVPLAEFTDEDQASIRAGLPSAPPEYRQYALYQGADVTPEWAGVEPKFPDRFYKVVDIVGDEVFFSSNSSLIAIKKSAFTAASLESITLAIKKTKRQIILDASRSPVTVLGQPIYETDDVFVMEVTTVNQQFRGYVPGSRYLLPKGSLGALLISQLAEICEVVRKESTAIALTADELQQLPRVCNTTSGARLITASAHGIAEDKISAITNEGGKAPLQPYELACTDLWWWEMQRLQKDGAPVTAEMEAEVLARLVDSSEKRGFWALKNRMGHMSYKLVGTIANGFVFDNSGINFCFVPADDLVEMDLRVAIEVTRHQEPNWLAEAELEKVLATRVIPMGGSLILGTVKTLKALDSALIGEYPTVVYPHLRDNNEISLGWHSALRMAREAYKWLEENRSLLNGSDKEKSMQALATEYPINAKGLESPVRLPPDRQVRAWKLAKEGNEFRGILVGQRESDLIFETSINGDVKYFLAAPDVLSAEAQGLVKQFLPRTEAKDWDSLLTRADNLQHFRVRFDPSGKVRSRAEPLVVESISESLMVFRGLDGRRTSEPLPQDPVRLKATLAFYGPALTGARKAREAAESSLSLWKFEDSEPILRAELIGSSDDSFLVRDVNGIEFLVNKSCLTSETRRLMASKFNVGGDMRRIEAAAVWELPRVWCTRTELVGPAIPQFLTSDDRQLVIKTPEASIETLNMSDLTLRERLSFITAWRLDHGGLNVRPELTSTDSAETVERLLSEPIAAGAVLSKLPELEPAIKQQVTDAFDKWIHATWRSTPIELPVSSSLLAVNADASAGVLEANSVWSVVEFETGKVQSIPEVKQVDESHSQLLGPWMGSDKQKCYWVDDSVLYCGQAGATERLALLDNHTPKILSACQTPSFQYLVLYLQDGSVRRWSLADNQLEVIVTASKRKPASAPSPKLWTSMDGNSVVIGDGSMSLLQVAARDRNPALVGQLFFQKQTLKAFVGRSRALLSFEEMPRQLTQLTAATSNLQPQTYGLPFQCAWLGFIDVDGQEAFQAIGRFEDASAMKSSKYFVHYRGPRDFFEQYPTQFIEGQIDERARMAANGAALVHWNGDQAIVSRRPAELPLAPKLRLNEIMERLIANRDIGQLEALSQFLENKPYSDFGPFSGSLNLDFQETVKIGCFNYQKQLGGDRLQRAIQLAEHFRKLFPDSQVAGNVLAEINRNLAWTARGGVYVNSVTDAGQVAFRTHMSNAYDLLKPMLAKEPSAATLHSTIDVAMGTGRLDLARGISKKVLSGKHAENAKLHHAISFLLLPRWHGKPGASESYRDSVDSKLGDAQGKAMYAQLVADMLVVHGYSQPLSKQIDVDLQRVLEGTEQYYQNHTDSTLIDSVILLMNIEAKNEWVTRLLQLKFHKQLLPSQTVASNPETFRSIERQLGN